jgi:hypothetical protein
MKRRHEITRLEAFSDAVFAFALTLLVVSLEVPHKEEDLINLMRGFLPFALMFSMICWIWYEHRQFFSQYELDDAWTTTLNCVLLFVVLFYVYPLKYVTVQLVGPWVGMVDPETHERLKNSMTRGDLVMLLYSAGVVLIFGTFVALYHHAGSRRAELGLTGEEQIALDSGRRGHTISALFGIASVGLAFIGHFRRSRGDAQVFVTAAGLIYMLMGPAHTWSGYRHGKAVAALRKKQTAIRK